MSDQPQWVMLSMLGDRHPGILVVLVLMRHLHPHIPTTPRDLGLVLCSLQPAGPK